MLSTFRKKVDPHSVFISENVVEHLPMSGILSIIRVVFRNQVKCIYLKNHSLVVDILLDF